MEMTRGPVKPVYYFSWIDQEILDEQTLTLSCDEETWLYKIETSKYKGQFEHYQLGSPFQDQQIPSTSGSVDSRTVTRRKHCSLRPSLDSVIESPLSNRSSLGLLGASKLLNDTLQALFTPTQSVGSREKTSTDFTASEPLGRTLNFDTVKTNSEVVKVNEFPQRNGTFERFRGDSESSDASIPHSLENFSPFEKNSLMTDSLLNFLEKQEVSCRPPKAFQDEDATGHSSLVLPERYEANNSRYICGSSEPLTDSLVNFLMPVNCKPPSGFEDSHMVSSVAGIPNGLPSSDSVMGNLENVNFSSLTPLVESTTSSETENIPPDNCDIQGLVSDYRSGCADRLKASGEGRNTEFGKVHSTFAAEKNGDGIFSSSNERDESANIKFTNNVNILRKRKDSGDVEEDLNITRSLKTNYDLDFYNIKDNNEKSVRLRALNNRDLNVTQILNSPEVNDLNLTKSLSKDLIATKSRGTYTKSEIDEALHLYKQIPSRDSTFNTTFTKLESKSESNNSRKDQNTTFVKHAELSNGLMEDDQTSSASDSSFSSCSTKPRSVDELRTIALQQETSLAQQTSTPQTSKGSSKLEAKLDLELSPIRRPSFGAVRNNNESRSANCSPVRSQIAQPQCMHPILKSQQPSIEYRRQSLQASSLSNIARPKMSGMRIPQPVSRFTAPQRSIVRPSTAPAPAPATTAIPRPRASRLPMPRLRGSGIPGPKRGGLH